MSAIQRTILNEITGTAKPYRYKINYIQNRSSHEGVVKFTTDEGDPFWGRFVAEILVQPEGRSLGIATMTVQFGIGVNPFMSTHRFTATNAGVSTALRIMSTLAKAAKEFMFNEYSFEKIKIDKMTFESVAYDKEGFADEKKSRQRTKLYTAIIKKTIPGVKIRNNGVAILCDIPNSLYRTLKKQYSWMKAA